MIQSKKAKKMLKEITILIPTYNRAELLDKNLESISTQDFKGKIKCVISDNASSDHTKDIVSKWKNRNMYITYLKNKNEIPPIENFINASKKIDTEYSKFLQDDDWLEPNALSRMSYYFDLHQADELIFNCNIFSYNQNQPRYNYYKLNNTQVSKDNVLNSFLRIDKTIPTSPSISVQKSEMIIEALNFSKKNIACTPLLLGNDLIFTYFGVFNHKKVHFINESVVNFWGGKDSITMYADRHLFSSCYFNSLLMLIQKFNYKPTDPQLEVLRHRIFVHNFKKLYKKELKDIMYDSLYTQKLSYSQLLKYIKTKLT